LNDIQVDCARKTDGLFHARFRRACVVTWRPGAARGGTFQPRLDDDGANISGAR
jgi:hypothetical protein